MTLRRWSRSISGHPRLWSARRRRRLIGRAVVISFLFAEPLAPTEPGHHHQDGNDGDYESKADDLVGPSTRAC